ncbi:MAG: hypothetical protein WBA74_09090 [Cyclobacteriaceae bacterium]
MKNLQYQFLSAIALLFLTSSLYAQDLVVTTAGDSINAEITKITDDHIYYAYYEGDKIVRVKSPKSEVASYLYIFYSKKRVIEYSFDLNNIKMRLSFSGGPSWATDGPPDSFNDFQKSYVRKVNSGWSYKLAADYFLKNRIGVGLQLERFLSVEQINDVVFTDPDTDISETGELSDDVGITYLGPSVVYHFDTKQNNYTAFFSLGAGYVWYNNDFIRIEPRKATGNTIGLHVSASMDFILLDHLMMGVEVSASYANLNSYEIIDENGQKEVITDNNDISRINLSVGIRIVK